MDINAFLETWPELTKMCSHHGWIDNSSLRTRVIEQMGCAMVVGVEFNEITGGDSTGGDNAIHHLGRVKINLNRNGKIASAYLL